MSSPHGSGAAVTAHNWGWCHAGRAAWAVRDLDLRIEPGERVLLLGPSGAGKSTLLHGVAGLLGGAEEGRQSGRLLVDGAPPGEQRHRIGMVLQDPDSQVILSRVGDDIAFGMENFGVEREHIWPRVRAALDAVGLNLGLSQSTSGLSGGQKQRLALAGVIAMDPGLILLDEPTANLDPDGVVEVRDAVAESAARTGATLIVIEHRTEVWLPVIDRVIVLGADGQVIADGTPDQTIRRHHDYLVRSGVWVPDTPLPEITRRRSGPDEPLLLATDLALGHPGDPVMDLGLSFEIEAGRTSVITGPNGAGKSTLALTLGGLLPVPAGCLEADAAFAPAPSRRKPVKWRSKELLTRIGSVFQDPEHQFLTGTVRDELALGPRAIKLNKAEISTRTDELLARLHLEHLAAVNPYTLSGGEKRRLSVATMLATAPKVIILDEPTFGQDRRTWEELIRLLAEIADDGTAVIAATHDLDFAGLLADNRIELPDWEATAEATS
ncbi:MULTISPECIES: ABC transporter ATP-binding protein [unclassified Mycolicibacterium]|uniref:ABC transporter ATP-binding protein n=1 Tax=unclassified Mycolicibacterium TaxID=2636767 RepID=UPI0012DDD357|nr:MULTISPECIES: ABC transporter ATP-binding protein [unclassified Mycolicibacterium]MUL85837.1 ABC transporter ATP-binding protein [Mycolicibacterium sp. CBMA 329]MUL90207.1 ABC transporter ATP-binding protein [Mycolicibacterium sp. CBMA 331]MUM00976.1 ABC transporter ATP-binding protein [Mycolicibacterium sp. CBMA 334]MUM27150.1 ABC transporter ATP-binding protein [Mycolicibacterium sp. CBMA 295]MUM39722.1 ABC transporter ATP-binding protein [Mycolicibacterium sp. CBMA 247]